MPRHKMGFSERQFLHRRAWVARQQSAKWSECTDLVWYSDVQFVNVSLSGTRRGSKGSADEGRQSLWCKTKRNSDYRCSCPLVQAWIMLPIASSQALLASGPPWLVTSRKATPRFGAIHTSARLTVLLPW